MTEIRSILDAPADSEPPPRAVVENMLTTGYAHVLVLEKERLQVEKRLRDALRISAQGGPLWADELANLTRQLEQADHDLARLRGLLASLRAHALSV